MQAINPCTKTNERCQKARSRSGITNEQLHRLIIRPPPRKCATLAVNSDRSIARLRRVLGKGNHETNFLQAIHHHLRIFTPKRSPQRHLPFSKCGKN
jgi:hypothetical protein